MVSIVVSTSSSPYEQWLIGRVVVMHDMAFTGLLSRNSACCNPASRCSQWWCRAQGTVGVVAGSHAMSISTGKNLKTKKTKL